jgi:hypothetical protein
MIVMGEYSEIKKAALSRQPYNYDFLSGSS